MEKQYAFGLQLNDFMLARDGLWITLINHFILHLVALVLYFFFYWLLETQAGYKELNWFGCMRTLLSFHKCV